MPMIGKEDVSCPACDEELARESVKDHLNAHVHRIEEGESAGSYTWQCACEAVPRHWHESTDAWHDLMSHMQQRHGIPVF